ncbi:MAG: hypothetical protein LBQ81_04100 [Zoogloeaceae bacterium]|jgi:hypothetical protein|nr:hypothetical protein [Zoogloeaceae bacterium]
MSLPRCLVAVATLSLLAGCAGIRESASGVASGIGDMTGSVVDAVSEAAPQTRQDIAGAALAYKLVKPAGADLVIFGLAYLVYDPLAPNWEIQETRLSEDVFQMQLSMKRHFSGGEGEAMRVLKRRAAQLQRELGYGGYRILDYNEGIESATLAAWRVGEGRVQLVRHQGSGIRNQESVALPKASPSWVCRAQFMGTAHFNIAAA